MQPAPEEPNVETRNYQPDLVIRNYLLLKRLGGTETTATFQAVDRNTQEIVVVKVFPKSLALATNLYNTEIQAFKKLQGTPGILSLKDTGEIQEAFFLTTEFIQDGSIRNLFTRYPNGMGVVEALDLFTPIADVVDRIHGKNIIHRDLKPENILFKKTDHGYEIFITDFGLVKFTNDSKLFQTETTAGTPLYIAPEAWSADHELSKTNAVDIYSLGVMLYEALEGKRPFENPAEAIRAEPPPPQRVSQETHPEVVEHILGALSKKPEERPFSAGALIDGVRNGYYNTLENIDQLWIGRRIRNYKIIEILGHGKMGITMLARDNQGKAFVLKAFETSLMVGNPKQLFEKEMKSFQNLEAEHGVLLPRESFSQKGIFYLVFDYQSGGNIRIFLSENRKQKDVDKILNVFTQIAEALDYTHSKKVIHRDLKPENVVYRMEGERIITFLTDFGIAEILEGTKSSFYTKTAAGTFYYMAPEAWNPRARKTKAMDIYSFGIMLYEALEGR
ncbi:MAG TPA: serine/threonine-protein kinase, partial [Anaerolineales bacterium]|nr:serine/threonine-protein kinase [Anaerolineales bacterium]